MSTGSGIVSWGTYVPRFRLQRSAVASAHGGRGSGTRAVAAPDEDTTTMGVEAARSAMHAAADRDVATGADLLFATTAPAYADKTNATAVHAALGLSADSAAYDTLGGLRSGTGSLLLAARSARPMLAVLSDCRVGLPGSADERAHGDAAAAFLCGSGSGVVAELIGQGSASAEFLDRWRAPGSARPQQWEERFAMEAYLDMAARAWANAVKDAGVGETEVSRVAIVGPHVRAVATVARERTRAGLTVVDDLTAQVGLAGAAHPGVVLASMLDDAQPGQILVLQTLTDGSDVLFFQTTEAIAAQRPFPPVSAQLAAGRDDLGYLRYLTWRGLLDVEPPRRPEPDRPAAPPSFRSAGFKFGFHGSRCLSCGRVSLPPRRVCYACGALDQAEPVPMENVQGTLANFTVDRLAYTPNPPMVAGLVDLDGGGRFQGELADVDVADLKKGMRMEMTFRRLYTAGGVHNYFWKARPARSTT